MAGTTPTTYLNPTNWGASTGGAAGVAEDLTTLGTDRLDTRVPPDQFRGSWLQISNMKNLLINMSSHFLGGTRLKALAQTANPFGAGEAGFWTDGTSPKFTSTTGTQTVLGGAGALSSTYSGTTPANNIIPLVTAGGPLLIRDASPGLGTTLLGVQDSTGTVKYLDVTAGTVGIGSAGTALLQFTAATTSQVVFSNNGSGAPTFTTRSNGTRLVLSSSLGASAAEYALGISASTLWLSVPTTASQFQWYGGTTLIGALSGTGTLTAGHFQGSTTLAAPSIAVGVALGTGGSVAAIMDTGTGSCTDAAGYIKLTVGSTSPTTGILCTVTFGTAYATTPKVVFNPNGAGSINTGNVVVTNISAAGFALYAYTAPTAGGTYGYTYHVIG